MTSRKLGRQFSGVGIAGRRCSSRTATGGVRAGRPRQSVWCGGCTWGRTGWCVSSCAWTASAVNQRATGPVRRFDAERAARLRALLSIDGTTCAEGSLWGRAVPSRKSISWVPLRLCVCRDVCGGSSTIVEVDQERDQDGSLVRVRDVAGHRGQ
jgi:hypothetical protein